MAVVTPQNWLFLGSYKRLREKLLKEESWNVVARLGPKGFQTPMWDFNTCLLVITSQRAEIETFIQSLDVAEEKAPEDKNSKLQERALVQVSQQRQLANPDARLVFSGHTSTSPLLSEFVECYQGVRTGDRSRFVVSFWEVTDFVRTWEALRNTSSSQNPADGITEAIRWENGHGDPLPAGQVWALSPGGTDENPGLFRIEVTEGPGSGLKILNQSPPGPLKESVRCAEQNLYARAKELVGDRDPRAHEFTIQFRAFDACKSAAATGIPILLAMSSALVERSLEGGLVIVGGLNLGGSIEPIYNAVSIIELAADKGAQKILMPVSARKQLFDLPDDLATKVTVVYYADAKDALLKALSE